MIKAIIVDDEPYCCESPVTLLERYCPAAKVADTCYSGETALTAIKKQQPQVVFPDIEIPRMNSCEMLKKLRDINFEIIFTASSQKKRNKLVENMNQ